jgi:hypothetical protein
MAPLRLTTLPRKLLDYTDQPIPSGRKLREGAVDAKFPAHQVNGLWHYNPDDLPAIAAVYGLTPKGQSTRRAPRARQAASPFVAA